ncbi:MAG: ABC transporter ATP-binding protein [Verrucomicrobiota bacterium]|nr:ABC transporter ATP-binding protein [Verrucomicrobiota bacterium]
MNLQLKAEKITKTFSGASCPILKGISLELKSGEAVAIKGRSGEGKSTLLHILGTLEECDSGSIEIAGVTVTKKNALSLRKRSIGFIFQAFYLLEEFTALENVLVPAAIDRRKSDRNWGLFLLDQVGLLERAHFPVKLLSGGERQRVAIARALCNRPSLLLADEPSGNLDAENSAAIGKLLLSTAKRENCSLLLVTHDAHLASLCSRTYALQNGLLQSE